MTCQERASARLKLCDTCTVTADTYAPPPPAASLAISAPSSSAAAAAPTAAKAVAKAAPPGAAEAWAAAQAAKAAPQPAQAGYVAARVADIETSAYQQQLPAYTELASSPPFLPFSSLSPPPLPAGEPRLSRRPRGASPPLLSLSLSRFAAFHTGDKQYTLRSAFYVHCAAADLCY